MTVPANEGGQNEVIDQGLGLMPQDQQTQQVPNQGQQEQQTINPAWNGLLSRVPQGLHGQILPELQQWDKNYNQGIQKVHSQYAAYKPFLDQNIDPNALNEGYLIRQALENDPLAVVQAMIQHYQLQLPTEQGQQQPGEQESDEDEALYDVTQDPEFQRMKQMVELMGQHTLMTQQQQQEAQADAALDTLITQAQQKHGEFDEDWVLQKLYFSGVDEPTEQDLDAAIDAYKEHVSSIVQNYRSPSQNAPVIMGGGGGLPSQQTPVGQMTGKDRRALIVQTLANLNANSGG